MHLPRFNPWHGSADLQNFFIVQRILSDVRGSAFADNMTIYPLAGCDGVAPTRGNGAIWSALTGGRMYPPAGKQGRGAGEDVQVLDISKFPDIQRM